MSAISQHFPPFLPLSVVEGTELPDSPWRVRQDVADEGTTGDGMRCTIALQSRTGQIVAVQSPSQLIALWRRTKDPPFQPPPPS